MPSESPNLRKISKQCKHWLHHGYTIVGPSTFLDLGSGMDCRKTLFRHRHFQFSDAELNPSSSSNHIWIVYISNCTFDTIVVLVVMFYHLGHSKNPWTELNHVNSIPSCIVVQSSLLVVSVSKNYQRWNNLYLFSVRGYQLALYTAVCSTVLSVKTALVML